MFEFFICIPVIYRQVLLLGCLIQISRLLNSLQNGQMKKRCRILPAGVWGCPLAIKVTQDWGIGGIIENISAV